MLNEWMDDHIGLSMIILYLIGFGIVGLTYLIWG